MKISTVTLWLLASTLGAGEAFALEAKNKDVENCLALDGFAATNETADVCTAALSKPDLSPAEKAKVLAKRADALYFATRLGMAIEDASEAIKLDPSLKEAYIRRANANILLGEFYRAREDITRALALNPDYANAYISLGWLYSYTNAGIAKMEAAYLRALEIEPENGLALLNMATIYFYDKHEIEKGLAYMERLLALGPEKLGKVVYWRGSDMQSRYDFYANVRIERANMFRQLKRNDQALADYNWVIEKYPAGNTAYLERARFRYGNQNDSSRALTDIEKTLELDPYREEAKLLKLHLLVAQKRSAEALSAANSLIDGAATEAGRAEALEVRSRLYKAMSQPDQALADLEQYLVMLPNMVIYYQQRLAEHGYYSGAINGEPSEALRIGLQACIADPDC
jgi:tetratricopeptide (TPR) repeat protein